jgi:hypothetical protein
MARQDWRSASAYDHLRSLDAPEFAFEFLRRNADFLKHHARLTRKKSIDPGELEAFAQRWGVRFRIRPAHRTRQCRPMDGEGSATRCCAGNLQ